MLILTLKLYRNLQDVLEAHSSNHMQNAIINNMLLILMLYILAIYYKCRRMLCLTI